VVPYEGRRSTCLNLGRLYDVGVGKLKRCRGNLGISQGVKETSSVPDKRSQHNHITQLMVQGGEKRCTMPEIRLLDGSEGPKRRLAHKVGWPSQPNSGG
jgi:hypothetical protein